MTQLLTHTGTPVSQLTFGTMQFGGTADADESRAMFERATMAGINHFDTAVGYTDGMAEKLLGGMIRDNREDLFIATKVAYTGGATRDNIRAQFDTCRKQLDQDAVDLLYLHRFDPDTPLEETFSTLAELQAAGAIRHLGVSNYAAWQVLKAQTVARSLGTQIDVIQPMYSLVKRQAEVEIFPMAEDQDIAIAPYSPLGGGLLTGKYAQGGTGRLTDDPRYRARYDQQWMHNTAVALNMLAQETGVAAATLAVAWVKTHAARPLPIISARSVTQLEPSLAAMAYDMPPDLHDRISALSVAPAPATDRLEEQ